ncbi:hypothetical protein C8J56DRAFT_922240 [Mycena floridula]|nr:hypothetical protein C8J56DRAFT_922240 [Mycena floridula]
MFAQISFRHGPWRRNGGGSSWELRYQSASHYEAYSSMGRERDRSIGLSEELYQTGMCRNLVLWKQSDDPDFRTILVRPLFFSVSSIILVSPTECPPRCCNNMSPTISGFFKARYTAVAKVMGRPSQRIGIALHAYRMLDIPGPSSTPSIIDILRGWPSNKRSFRYVPCDLSPLYPSAGSLAPDQRSQDPLDLSRWLTSFNILQHQPCSFGHLHSPWALCRAFFF